MNDPRGHLPVGSSSLPTERTAPCCLARLPDRRIAGVYRRDISPLPCSQRVLSSWIYLPDSPGRVFEPFTLPNSQRGLNLRVHVCFANSIIEIGHDTTVGVCSTSAGLLFHVGDGTSLPALHSAGERKSNSRGKAMIGIAQNRWQVPRADFCFLDAWDTPPALIAWRSRILPSMHSENPGPILTSLAEHSPIAMVSVVEHLFDVQLHSRLSFSMMVLC